MEADVYVYLLRYWIDGIQRNAMLSADIWQGKASRMSLDCVAAATHTDAHVIIHAFRPAQQQTPINMRCMCTSHLQRWWNERE